MTLGEHITLLRKQKNLSQNDLGKKVGTSGDIIGRYERDEVKPSIEVVIKLSEALAVSIDYLVGKVDIELDNDTVQRIQNIQKLPQEGKKQIFMVVDALIRDFKARKIYAAL
jgi:transcriptional regulator with XRE-family HTH domain